MNPNQRLLVATAIGSTGLGLIWGFMTPRMPAPASDPGIIIREEPPTPNEPVATEGCIPVRVIPSMASEHGNMGTQLPACPDAQNLFFNVQNQFIFPIQQKTDPQPG